MTLNNYVTLQLVRLPPVQPWRCAGKGLEYVFMKHGACEYVSGTMRHRLTPGGMMVLNPSETGSVRSLNEEESTFWHFSAALEHMVPLFEGREISMLPTLIERFRTGKVYPPSTHLAQECHKLLAETPTAPGLGHRGQLLRIIATILSEEMQSAETKPGGYSRIEDRMLHAYETLLVDDLLTLSVEKLAARLGCSRRHLARLFHQHFGTSVVALRTEMRLLKAVSLLRNPATKIIYVARESGFNHLGLFHHCFKKRFGSSPGQWRKANA